MISDLDKAYAAGLFEGEGCVQVLGRRFAGGCFYQLVCKIQMSDRDVLDWLQERWYGNIHSSRDRRANRRQMFQWCLTPGHAAPFLRDVQPHLHMRRMQIKVGVALAFQEQKRSSGRGDKVYLQRQHDFYILMGQLNQRGDASLTNDDREMLSRMVA